MSMKMILQAMLASGVAIFAVNMFANRPGIFQTIFRG